MSMSCQRSYATAVPTVQNVRRPTILHPSVHARNVPVSSSHFHHLAEKARYRSWWNLMYDSSESDMNRIKAPSSRIRRVSVTCRLSGKRAARKTKISVSCDERDG